MTKHQVTVVIPTLHAGEQLKETLDSLAAQTFQDFHVIIADNSGSRAAAPLAVESRFPLTVMYMDRNVGFGAAINRALRKDHAPLVALLNDDAPPHPDWLRHLVREATTFPEFGMFACQVRLAGTRLLDSAGLLMSRDGSSIQRGHRQPWDKFPPPSSTLFPSGCAALYRRKALIDAGFFDSRFFLYCEDSDIGLRMIWQGWRCRYVHGAIVDHHYSATAGVVSPLKAYLVERNRIYLVIKNLPFTDSVSALTLAPVRYFWHVLELVSGRGKTRGFAESANPLMLPWLVLKAHVAALIEFPRLARLRHHIQRRARISKTKFREQIYAHRVSLREVAKH